MSTIFTTIHGSRLYGLEHASSDHDYYRVVTDKHRFEEGERGQRVRSFGDKTEDTLVITFTDFLRRVSKGSHQALEALFSPVKVWDDAGLSRKPFIEAQRVTSPDAFEAYERTIRKFAFGDFKRRRHGVRLSMNLGELRYMGRFNPHMTPKQIGYANECATTLSGNAMLRELDIPLSDDYAGTQTQNEGDTA